MVAAGTANVDSNRTQSVKTLFTRTVNIFLSVGYISYAFVVASQVVNGHVNLFSGLIVLLFFIIQAYGHMRMSTWAMKISAALFGVMNIFSVFYLLPSYESELMPSFSERLLKFIGITIITVFVISTYWIANTRERKAVAKSKRKPPNIQN